MADVTVGNTLALDRCPRCGIAKPLLSRHNALNSKQGFWAMYACSVCGGIMLARAQGDGSPMLECLPASPGIAIEVPERAREYLRQAQETFAQAAASIVMSAAAIDAMLKNRGLTKGSLYERIDKAAEEHLITADMAKWAHQVRLDANDQRHADEAAPLPTTAEAERCFKFAMALAEVFFVLPSRVTRGIEETKAK
jgi:hypothetical protein